MKIPNKSQDLESQLDACHQKLGLYVDILDQFRKSVVKKYEKDLALFLETMVKRIKSIKDEYRKESNDVLKNMGLFKIELDNQVQVNLNIEYENIILKSKESTYM